MEVKNFLFTVNIQWKSSVNITKGHRDDKMYSL